MTMTKWVCTFWDGAAEDSEDRYQLLRIVGHGSTAVVACAVDRQSGQQVAIKRMGTIFVNRDYALQVLREIRPLSVLSSERRLPKYHHCAKRLEPV